MGDSEAPSRTGLIDRVWAVERIRIGKCTLGLSKYGKFIQFDVLVQVKTF